MKFVISVNPINPRSKILKLFSREKRSSVVGLPVNPGERSRLQVSLLTLLASW